MSHRDDLVADLNAFNVEARTRLRAILADLSERYQPQSSLEQGVLEDLARSVQRREELQSALDAFLAYQRTRVALKLEEQLREAFTKHQRQWRKDPALFIESFGRNCFGAMTLAEIWARLAGRLESSVPLVGMDEACEALLALGLSDRIQNQADEGWWWMGRFLAIHADPKQAVKIWARRSRSKDPIIDQLRADQAIAASPEQARQELLSRASELAGHWAGQAARLLDEQRAAVALCQQCVQADRQVAAGLKSLNALLNQELKTQERLEKKLRLMQAEQARPSVVVARKPEPKAAVQSASPGRKPLHETIQAWLAQHPLTIEELVQLEMGLEDKTIRTIDPAHAAQMFSQWHDEDVMDAPAYARFHELFDHLPDQALRLRLLEMLKAETQKRESDEWGLLDAG